MIDTSTSNMIIFYFPVFSGGKFLMNCLSLSKYCVPQSIKIAEHSLLEPEDYNFKLQEILKTLPPVTDLKHWVQQWEFNPYDFYGPLAEVTTQGIFQNWKNKKSNNVDQLLTKLINNDIDFFAYTRTFNTLKSMVEVFPNAKIIILANFEKFQKLAFDLKQSNPWPGYSNLCGNECQEKYNMLKGNNWPSWRKFQKFNYNIDEVAKNIDVNQNVVDEIKQFYPWYQIKNPMFNVDVDGTYFNKDKFFEQMKELYSWLGYDDFNEILMSKYYTAYIDIHKN